jgi:outer membrane lipoprotein-sorting protein
MKLKNLVLYISLVLFALKGYSQEYLPVASMEKINKLITDNANSINSIKGDFVQSKLIASLGIKVESAGKFYFKKQGDKLRWEYTSPTQFAVIFSNGEFQIQQKDNIGSSTNKIDALFTELNNIIIKTLNGNLSDTEGFVKETFESKDHYRIQLSPVSDNKLSKVLQKLEIDFSKKDLSVSEMKMHELGGDITSISFLNLEKNTVLQEALFLIK